MSFTQNYSRDIKVKQGERKIPMETESLVQDDEEKTASQKKVSFISSNIPVISLRVEPRL